jgi:hypothetical protein
MAICLTKVEKAALATMEEAYAWFTKINKELIYIGKATGSGGLRKRIWSQHLNPVYLGCRTSR